MSDIFISYSRKDSVFARRLFDALKATEREMWIDWEDIPHSVDWWREICMGIDSAECFVAIITPSSLTSKVCTREVQYALQNNKRLIPIMHQPIDDKQLGGEWYTWKDPDLEKVARSNWATLQSLNWIFFREEDNFDPAFTDFIHTIEQDPALVKLHTRLLVKAREWEMDHDASLLLRGTDLQEAENWLAFGINRDPIPTALHAEYVQASVRQREDELRAAQEQQARELALQTRAARFLRSLVGVLLVATVIALGLSAFAFGQRQEAQTARSTSDYNADVAVAARSTSDYNADVAVAARSTSDYNADVAVAARSTSDYNADVAVAARSTSDYNAEVAIAARSTSDYNAMVAATNESIAFMQSTAVAQQRDHSDSLRLAAAANTLLQDNGNAEVAALLNVRALNLSYSPEADTVLQTAIARLQTKKMFVVGNNVSDVTAIWSPDGKWIAAGSGGYIYRGNGTVHIWDVTTDSEIQTFKNLNSYISCLAFSPDATKLLICNGSSLNLKEDSSALIYDVATGELLTTLAHPHQNVMSAAWSPDGTQIATGTGRPLSNDNGDVKLWDAASGDLLDSYREADKEAVWKVEFSADATQILAASSKFPGAETELRLWENGYGIATSVWTYNPAIENPVAGFSRSGKDVVIGAQGQPLDHWEIATGTTDESADDNSDPILDRQFSADGKLMLIEGLDANVEVRDVASGQAQRTLSGHRGSISQMAFSPAGDLIMTASNDGTIRLWDANPDASAASAADSTVFEGSTETIRSLAFSPDGKTLAVGGDKVYLWDIATGKLLTSFNHHQFGEIMSLAVSPAGIFTGGWDLTAILQDWQGNIIRTFDTISSGLNAMAVSSDGRLLLAGAGNDLAIWDVATGKQINLLKGHTDTIAAIAISDDNTLAATTSSDATAILWDLTTGLELQHFIGHNYWVDAVAISPDKSKVVTGGFDATVRLWDAKTGQEIRQFFGHTDSIWGVAFSPDGKQLLTSSGDGTARLWDVETGAELRQLIGHTELVWGVAYSPDGLHIATSSSDQTARLWTTDWRDTITQACSRIFADLTVFERDKYVITDPSPVCTSLYPLMR